MSGAAGLRAEGSGGSSPWDEAWIERLLDSTGLQAELGAEGACDAGPEPIRDGVHARGATREIHDLLRPDHFTRHVAAAAKSVDETELDTLGAGPDQPAEDVVAQGESIPSGRA